MWTLVIILFLSFQNKAGKNYFEGWLKYKHEVIIKNTNIDSLALREFVGKGSTLYFKEGNYLHTFDGGAIIKHLYRKDDNKTYFKFACKDGFIFLDDIQLEGKKRILIEDFLRGYRFS